MTPPGENKRTFCTCFDNSTRPGRNLVVCIDGTSNQFGDYNTNVVELYSRVIESENQLTYYNSGIGTYANLSWASWSSWRQWFDNIVDLAIAWNFDRVLRGAYRWLSDNYQDGDRIYLFGFSRGAYQVRSLAGMIETVGLIRKGNDEQIPFAYELYMGPMWHQSRTFGLAARFKKTFSRKNVRVHFVGVWDTVSSVGLFKDKSFPLTDTANHVCYFRHALALDERRVKFIPEYVRGTAFDSEERVKEVWFAGTHSDMLDCKLGSVSFQWMAREAILRGLQLASPTEEWQFHKLGEVKESLRGFWQVLEHLPIDWLSYDNEHFQRGSLRSTNS
ncbi:hypothetical protein F5887DRAFT_897308 [Amanita rubescens]|nr:hypothetical protein F5887DRAFT_897308 [Amanita rubescens]